MTSGEFQVRDALWLKSHIPDGAHAVLTDVTSGLAVLGVMGPGARALLQSLSPDDLGNDAFPFGTSREIELAQAYVRASRITYVGELGWELYMPTEFALGVYDALADAGQDAGLRPVGMHAMNSLRIEKAYRHYGHDIADADTPLEAGLAFAVKLDKPGGFIGRDALLRQREAGVRQRLVQFLLEDPAPLLYHNEPIWRDDAICGYVRSGMYGHTLGGAVGLGYVENADGVDADHVSAGRYEIEVAGVRYPRPGLPPSSLRPPVSPHQGLNASPHCAAFAPAALRRLCPCAAAARDWGSRITRDSGREGWRGTTSSSEQGRPGACSRTGSPPGRKTGFCCSKAAAPTPRPISGSRRRDQVDPEPALQLDVHERARSLAQWARRHVAGRQGARRLQLDQRHDLSARPARGL